MIMIESKFEIGQLVFLKTDNEQSERMVIGIHVRPTGIIYSLAFGAMETTHYELEISEQKNVIA